MIRIHVSSRQRNLIAGTLALGLGLATVGSAAAQLPLRLPDLPPGLPRVIDSAVGQVRATGDRVRGVVMAEMARARPDVLDLDDRGNLVVRDEIVALAPSAGLLARARAKGFVVGEDKPDDTLGVRLVVLRPPRGESARRALKEIRALDPTGVFDLDHILLPSAAAEGSSESVATPASDDDTRTRIGMIDGGVATNHPVFATVRIEQRGFAGAVKAGPHGTAVASLLVGRGPGLPDGARSTQLYAADVYGASPAGGSALMILAAMRWLATTRVGVVNVSLVGPNDATIKAGVTALMARGILVVAPVGNEGPAAGPLYPASYDGVVAVTAIDAKGRLLPEAGRAKHLDFAAPGVVLAAVPGGGFKKMRGTSFASPQVAERLARDLPRADPTGARRAMEHLKRTAADLGAFEGGRLHGFGASPPSDATTRR